MLKRRLGRRARAAVPVGLMTAAVLIFASAVPASASSGTITTNSAFCLTDGGSTANSAPITQYTCNGNAKAQTWVVLPGSDPFGLATFVIENTTNSKCMTNGGSTRNSAPITQYTCNGSPNQQWDVYPNETGSREVFESDAVTGECITNGGSTSNSTPITQYDCGNMSDWNLYFQEH
jgi:hypothetical protein